MDYAFVFILGTMVGSFMNVCIYRLPAGESIAWPGSHCLACGKAIKWYHNVPLVSYLALRRRCASCKTKFSSQYFWIEALTGLFFIAFYREFGVSVGSVGLLFFALAMVVQTVIDFRHKVIPEAITLPGIAIGLIVSALVPALHGQPDWKGGIIQSAIGAAAGAGFLFFLGAGAKFVLKKEALGFGDVELIGMIGAFLGLPGVAWTLFIGSFSGAIVGGIYQAVKKEEQIPFGPFLGMAAVAYIFFGEVLINWYFSAFKGL